MPPPPPSVSATPQLRIGHGWDMHRLVGPDEAGGGQPARPLVIGGVRPGTDMRVVAHSDGDVLYHAVTDALLGAIGGPDIGQLFPDTDPALAGRDSEVFLSEAARRVAEAGWRVGNLDTTVICEKVRIAPLRAGIAANLARVLGIEPGGVSIKGKTHEGVDAVGQGRAIEAHAVVLLVALES